MLTVVFVAAAAATLARAGDFVASIAIDLNDESNLVSSFGGQASVSYTDQFTVSTADPNTEASFVESVEFVGQCVENNNGQDDNAGQRLLCPIPNDFPTNAAGQAPSNRLGLVAEGVNTYCRPVLGTNPPPALVIKLKHPVSKARVELGDDFNTGPGAAPALDDGITVIVARGDKPPVSATTKALAARTINGNTAGHRTSVTIIGFNNNGGNGLFDDIVIPYTDDVGANSARGCLASISVPATDVDVEVNDDDDDDDSSSSSSDV
eukprot:CAMPEP_0198307184 /NCGR_PEP_ID=MMETSP1450-20131203/95_1 /TAXON_ID=753684 ORGANISM="Madagascaria erythrocladiodes, Strain CCMP3234" /NCGR_SAMPLE_ID=MMETSP1450 /ASSEMBLY_ACC=CAM_ASM_001115 /LENGTH=264 /DNA_ID=CAMNT_0044009749 /DNA_START=83 /DNA_END=874 /DNA_ORIENTATION=-